MKRQDRETANAGSGLWSPAARKPKQVRLHPWTKAGKHRVYSLADICRLYGVSRNTPPNWLSQGLPTIDDQRPASVSGEALNQFHYQRWKNARRPVENDEMICLPCGCPRSPKSDTLRWVSSQSGAGLLTGSCPVCSGSIFRFVTKAQASAFFDTASPTAERNDNTVSPRPSSRQLCKKAPPEPVLKNPSNLRVRHAWQYHLEVGRKLSSRTVAPALAALTRFEVYLGGKEFKRVKARDVIGFREDLKRSTTETGDRLSLSTARHVLMHCQEFMRWLNLQKGQRRFREDLFDYFVLSRSDMAAFRQPADREIASWDILVRILDALPQGTLVEHRDRALVALIMLTGMRADAVASLRIGDVDLEGRMIVQDARHVRSKNKKCHEILFLPVSATAEACLAEWIARLRRLGAPDRSALFIKTPTLEQVVGDRLPADADLSVWRGSKPVRSICRNAFERAGERYCIPHNIRKSVVAHLKKADLSDQELRAISDNLGHESTITTENSYGKPTRDRKRHMFSKIKDRLKLLEGDFNPDMTIRDLIQHRPDIAPDLIAALAKRQGDEQK